MFELIIKAFLSLCLDRSHNYGSVGAMMARAMVKAVDEIGVNYDSDGRLILPNRQNETLSTNHLEEKRDCLKNALLDVHAGTDLVNLFLIFIVDQNF